MIFFSKSIDFKYELQNIFIIIIATVGCVHQKKNDLSNLTPIVVDWNYKDLDYSHWVEDSVLVVPLETKDDCLIGEITYLVYQNHKIYVGDNMSKAIYVFNEEGKLLSTLRKVGNGPEEYLDISAFTVHDSQLLIFDKMKRKIFFYQEDGDFLYEKDASKVWCLEMFCLGDDLYLYNDGKSPLGCYHLYKLDLQEGKGEVQTISPFENMDISKWGINRYCSAYGDEAVFTVWPYDIIYKVKNGEANPAYRVDFGDRRLPDQYIYKDAMIALQTASRDNYITGIEAIGLTKRYMFITYSDANETPTVIYDKETGKQFAAKSFFNKNLGEYQNMLSKTSMQDGYMVTYSPIETFVLTKEMGYDWNEKEFASEHIRETFKKLQQADIEDNPVIIIQKIKEDVELF